MNKTSLILLLLLWTSGFSQEVLNFQNINKAEGLSSSDVRDILQDQYGFMWFATDNGLNRWDGQNILVLKHDSANKESLSSNNITALLLDSQNRFWIGTDKGLNLFNPIHFTSKHFRYDSLNNMSISGDVIRSIYEDNYGKIWLTSSDQKCKLSYLESSEKGIFKRFCHNPEDSTSIRPFSNGLIAQDENDKYWVGSWIDFRSIDTFRLETQIFHHLPFKKRIESGKNLVPELVNCIFKDSKKNLWFGTYLGVYVYLHQKKEFVYYRTIFNGSSNIKTIIEDEDGSIWFGAYGAGLFRFNPQTEELTNYTISKNKNISRSSIIRKLYKDQQERIWIASFDGVYFLDTHKNQFDLITFNDQKRSIGTGAIAEDSNGKLWFDAILGVRYYGGIGKGCISYDPKTKETKAYFKNTFINQIFPLNEDVFFASKDNVFTLKNKQLLKGEGVYAKDLFYDQNDPNLLWVVGIRGIFKLDLVNDSMVQFIPTNKTNAKATTITFSGKEYNLEFNNFFQIDKSTKDKNGNLWLIAHKYNQNYNILYKLDYNDSVIRPFSEQSEIVPTSVLADSKNRIWISSQSGLYQYHPETKTLDHISTSDGLPTNQLYAVLEDLQNNLWLFHAEGITKYNPENFSFENHSKHDDIYVSHIDQGEKNYYFSKKTNQMYYGTREGIISFKPDELKPDTLTPHMKITAFKIYNDLQQLDSAVFIKKHIILDHTENFFSFDFSGFNFSSHKYNHYKYILKNYDTKWNNTDQNTANYTKVPPGEFTFQVKAYNEIESLATEIAQIHVSILPPWWMKKWVQLLAVILITLLIASLIFSRINKLKKSQFQLESLINKRTKELEKQKMEVVSQARELENTNKKLHELSKFKDIMTSMIVHDLKSPLNYIINAPEDDLKSSIYRIKKLGRQMLNLVLDILDVFKSEDSRLKIKQHNYHLLPLINDAIVEVDYLAQNKNIEILNLTDTSIGVFTEKDLFIRIINNLLLNALKYTNRDGKIRITSNIIHNGFVKINVCDNGRGIVQKDMNMIFDKFVQIDNTDLGNLKSNGLGLTFCKMAVEAHGGKISVRSTYGEGSIFSIELPLSNNDMQLSDVKEIKSQKIAVTDFNFTPEEIEILKNSAEMLSKTLVYEVSIVKQILSKIPEDTENIKKWKTEVNSSLSFLDVNSFNDLIKKIL